MTEKSCRRIVCVLCTSRELVCYVCKQRVPLLFRSISLGVFGIERKSHVEAVKPYLVWINLLMPELSRLCTRMRIKLLTNLSGYTAITLVLIAIHVVKIEIDSCRTDMVYIII